MVWQFWIAFVATVALLGGTIWAGRTKRRRLHFTLAPLALVGLTIAIVLTERLSRAYDFPKDELATHLIFAKTAAGCVLAAALTGIASVRRPGFLKLHRICVVATGIFVLTATGTGLWVFDLATPR